MKTIDEKTLKIAVLNAKNIAQVIANMKHTDSSSGRKTIKKYIIKYNIDTSHFETTKERYERVLKHYQEDIKLLNSDIFIENSNHHLSGYSLKKRLYKEGLKKPICEKCGQDENWHGEHIGMILDHINGIHNDNRFENLRILCPNCNAALPTHCRGNNKLKKQKEKIENKNKHYFNLSISQRKVKRPKYEILKQEINDFGYTGTGKKYGVSDNAIRKWIKFYEKHILS
jgi:hypothetical protein